MARKRTLGVSTSEDGATASSLRHNVSPRSPMSQGTFDSSMDIRSTHTGNASMAGNASMGVGGTTSFVGSVIGHDDPTLIHANIQECFSSGINDSATLSSFLTEVTSEDIRDSSHTSRGGVSERQGSIRSLANVDILEQELTELDKTQEKWKERHEEELQFSSHHNRGREMDSAGDHYLEEVGGFHQTTPRKKGISLQEQIILEEGESCEESSREPSVAGSPPPPEYSDRNMLENAKATEAAIAAAGAGGSLMAFSGAFGSSSIDSSVADSAPSDLVYEYPSTEGSGGRRTPLQNVDEESFSDQEPADDVSHLQEQEPQEREVVLHEGQRRIYGTAVDNTSHGTELLHLPRGEPIGSERVQPPSDQRRKGFKSWIPVHDDSERSRSWLRSGNGLADRKDQPDADDSVEDDEYRKRRRKLCCLNICLVLLVIAAIVCTVLLTLTFVSRDGKTTNRDTSVAGTATSSGSESGRDPNPTFNLMPPNMAPSQSPAPQDISTTSSPVLPSSQLDDDDNNDSSPSASAEGGTTDSNSSTGDNSNTSDPSLGLSTNSPSPPTPPTDVLEEDVNSNVSITSSPGEAPTEPIVSGRDDSDESTSTSSPSAPVVVLRPPAEEVLVGISGDAIYDANTPQHAAYDWLQNEDPANLDLETISEQELSERYVAALFYFSLNGDDWVEKYGFLDESHVCEWNNGSPRNKLGIACDSPGTVDGVSVSKFGPVTGLMLNENNLEGSLPNEIEAFTDLRTIQLRSNKVSGDLPLGLGNLLKLLEIDLRENSLSGTVPESVFNLPDIRNILLLRNTNLGGTIPNSIDQASNLEMLSFQKCQMTGTLPDSLGNLSNLFFVTFMDNRLSGTIPNAIAQLPMLEVLELSGNQLYGTIPGFGSQTDLYFVSLFDNQLTGSIPVSLASLPGLLFLDIRDNLLTGSIPRIIGRLPDLVTFFAQNNQLTGPIPSFSGNNGLLQSINLSNNNLSGDIYLFFGTNGPQNRLFSVDLGSNNLSGSVPNSIGGYDALKNLVLENNQLTGTIPIDIGALTELDSLVLRQNAMTGTLPEEIGLMENLVYVDVGENQFEGTIPDTLIMLPHLEVLDVASNTLDGSVPSSFSRLSNLSEFYLQGNDFQGDLTNTFCSTSQAIGTFVADCMGPEAEVDCACCTICCNDDGCEENA